MKRWLTGAVAATAALTLAACGSSGGGTQSPAAPATTDTSATTDAPGESTDAAGAGDSGTLPGCQATPINFQLSFFPNAQYAPLQVAEADGLFEAHGVDVTLTPGGPTINATNQIAQGLVDMALIEFSEIQNANLAGADLVWVAQFYQRSPVLFMAMPDTPLSTPEDFRGQTINTYSGDLDNELHTLMDMAGVGVDEVTIKPGGFSILQDLVDPAAEFTVYIAQTFFHIAELAGAGMSVDDFNVIDPNELGAAGAPHGIAVTREFLDANPDAVACFLAAVVEGVNSVVNDPERATEVVTAARDANLGPADPALERVSVDETIKLLTMRPDGSQTDPLVIDNDFLTSSQEMLVKYGTLPSAPPLDSFVDPAPLAAAQALVG